MCRSMSRDDNKDTSGVTQRDEGDGKNDAEDSIVTKKETEIWVPCAQGSV